MDILGGAGICRGEANFIGNSWMSLPIGITVEGANIMTRSFMCGYIDIYIYIYIYIDRYV